MSVIFSSIASTFNLTPSSLHNLLLNNDILISGPAALTGYLQQNNIPGFDASRMDIWINGRNPQWIQSLLTTQPHLSIQHRFTTFLEKNNYINMVKLHVLLSGKSAPLNNDNHSMIRILNFCHPLGKVIRLIFLMDESVKPNAIIKRSEFNIDNCWYDHNTNIFHSYSPSTILRKEIYACPHDDFIPSLESLTKQQRIHLDFYMSIGFILGKEQCKILEQKDPRIMSNSNLHGIKAFDIYAYEEVDAVEFLDISYWNILLKTGDQFQAFHRINLYDYMKEHKSYIIIGDNNTFSTKKRLFIKAKNVSPEKILLFNPPKFKPS